MMTSGKSLYAAARARLWVSLHPLMKTHGIFRKLFIPRRLRGWVDGLDLIPEERALLWGAALFAAVLVWLCWKNW